MKVYMTVVESYYDNGNEQVCDSNIINVFASKEEAEKCVSDIESHFLDEDCLLNGKENGIDVFIVEKDLLGTYNPEDRKNQTGSFNNRLWKE